MAWNAYPWKDGELVKCPISLHAGCYADCLQEVAGNLSVRYQPQIKEEPSWCLETVKSVLDNFKSWKRFEYHFRNTNVNESIFNDVRDFLKWCSDNNCGIWFSF